MEDTRRRSFGKNKSSNVGAGMLGALQLALYYVLLSALVGQANKHAPCDIDSTSHSVWSRSNLPTVDERMTSGSKVWQKAVDTLGGASSFTADQFINTSRKLSGRNPIRLKDSVTKEVMVSVTASVKKTLAKGGDCSPGGIPLLNKTYRTRQVEMDYETMLCLITRFFMGVLPVPKPKAEKSTRSSPKQNIITAKPYRVDFHLPFQTKFVNSRGFVRYLFHWISSTYKQSENWGRKFKAIRYYEAESPLFEHSQIPLIPIDHSRIRKGDFSKMNDIIQPVYANKILGNTVLQGGRFSEQQTWVFNPELYVLRLLALDPLSPNEALVTLFETPSTARQHIMIHFDAASAYSGSGNRQTDFKFNLKKAFIAFKAVMTTQEYISNKSLAMVIGEWGCGSFGHSLFIQILAQWIAVSLVENLHPNVKRHSNSTPYIITYAHEPDQFIVRLLLDLQNEHVSVGNIVVGIMRAVANFSKHDMIRSIPPQSVFDSIMSIHKGQH